MKGVLKLCLPCIFCALVIAHGQAQAQDAVLGNWKSKDVEVVILSDGYRDMDGKVFLAKTPEQEALRARVYPDGKTRNSLNAFLVKAGGKLMLVDTGGGQILGPGTGGLFDALSKAGVSPDAIDMVIITHAHRDHVGGLAKDGKAAFPKATVRVSKIEHDFWLSKEEEAKAPEARRSTFSTFRDMLALYPGKVQTFEPGGELLPGVSTIAAYGHTPGHVAVLAGGQGEKLLIWADLLHGLALQMADPAIAVSFDSDPAAAIESRKALLAKAAKEGWIVTGVHVPGPEIYKLKAEGAGYAAAK
jgi:glyoxylase-like metal-dependent hydrolase (beta-lactamase superfamily II)